MFPKQTLLRALVLAGIAASASAMARADTVNFVLMSQGETIDFTLPSSPEVSSHSQHDSHSQSGYDVQLNDVSMSVNGAQQTHGLYFYTNEAGWHDASVKISSAGVAPSPPNVSTVPEPSSFLLSAGGLAFLAALGVRAFYRKQHHPPQTHAAVSGDAQLGEDA